MSAEQDMTEQTTTGQTATDQTTTGQKATELRRATVRALEGPVPEAIRGRVIPATVPGSVHTDLMAAGLLDDPYLDENELTQFWVGRCSWRYELEFDWQPRAERTDLRLDGIDTLGTVFVNGVELGSTRNMHRRYRFRLDDHLRPGANTVRIDFEAPRPAAERASVALGRRPHAAKHPYNAIRKMACSFGWDWGPDTATSGIWRPAVIEEWSLARLAAVRPIAVAADGGGVVDVEIEVERTDDRVLEVVAEVAGATVVHRIAAGETRASLSIPVAVVERWWPAGYGAQPLSDLSVVLRRDGEVLDRATRRIGFRTVEAATMPDADGTAFTVRVNGVDILVRGANWIPDDVFPHRVTPERLAERLAQARFARINLLRVWGGGVYESDEFYELCDELGILVWQDFLAACAAYSEEEPLASEFEAEARDNVGRLAHHPSLAVLNGNNECIWGHDAWNWKPTLDGRTWGHGYYYDLFARVVAELAPHVPYTPGSPFSPDPSTAPNDPAHGTSHLWDVWNEVDYTRYRDKRPRFVSEFGWQGPPTSATLAEAVHDDPLTPESPGMQIHQKALNGIRKLENGLVPHFVVPGEMTDWLWAMSLNQAIAIRTGIEYFRSLRPVCMGTIVWQLNDCWPVTSWAAVDGRGRPKPLLYALRDAHADRLVTIQPGPELAAVVVNDTGEPWASVLRVERLAYDGRRLAHAATEVRVEAHGSVRIALDSEVVGTGDPAGEYIRAEVDAVVARWFFTDYRDSRLTLPRWDASLEREGAQYRLTVTADALVRDLSLLVDRLDPAATVDAMLTTLDAGDAAVVTFASDRDLTLGDLTSPLVLRSANDLVATPARS